MNGPTRGHRLLAYALLLASGFLASLASVALAQSEARAAVSAIVIFCAQLLLWPAQSVAVQVRVMILGHTPVTASLWLIVGWGSQLSVAVALPVALGSVEALQSTVVSAGQVILGAVVSTTLMVCAQLAVMPVELLGVGVAPRHHRGPLGDAQIGLSQPYSVPAGEAIEPLDGGMQQLGVGRKRDGLGLHGGVDRDPLEIPRAQRAGLVRNTQALG